MPSVPPPTAQAAQREALRRELLKRIIQSEALRRQQRMAANK